MTFGSKFTLPNEYIRPDPGGETNIIGGTFTNPATTPSYVTSFTRNNNLIADSEEQGHRTGPGSRLTGETGTDANRWGYTTETGTSVEINNENGKETVSLLHFTGAAITIDSDGSIHLIPKGSKGWNLNSDRGTGLLYAHGDIVMKSGKSVFIQSSSNIEMNVGGDFLLNVEGNFLTKVNGNQQTVVNGVNSTETVLDRIDTVAGNHRTTIAGDSRTQVSGSLRHDVGKDLDTRVQQKMEMSAQESAAFQSKADMLIQSQSGALTVNSNEDTLVQSQKAVRVLGKSNVTIDSSDGGIYQRAQSEVLMSSKDAVNIDSTSSITIRSTDIRFDAESSFDARAASSMALNSESVMDIRGDSVNINGASTVDMRGGTIDLNKAGPVSPNGTGSKQTTTPRGAVAPEEFDAPEFVDANTIIDSLTTRREAPEFPVNAVGMSAPAIRIYQNEGGPDLPARIRSEADSNPELYGDGENVPLSNLNFGSDMQPPSENTSVAVQNPLPIPASTDNNAMISRYFNCNQYFYGKRAPRQHVINAMNLFWNIVDPLVDEFSSRGVNLIVAGGGNPRLSGAGYRPNGSPRSQHFTAEAVDIQPIPANKHSLGFEIAEWVYKNLPWNTILFEVSGNGNALIHLASNKPGQNAGGGSILTCRDPNCRTNVQGLNWHQYVRYLQSRGISAR